MNQRCFSRRARSIGAALLALAVLSNCSSGGGNGGIDRAKDPLGAARAAMQKAGSGRIHGSSIGANGATVGTVDGVWSAAGSGSGDVHADLVSFHGATIATELRFTNKVLYLNRAVASVSANDPLSVFTRGDHQKPWRKANLNGGIVNVIPAAFSPAALLQQLQLLHVGMISHGGESIGTTKATRLTTKNPVAVGVWLGATVDVWVDESSRVLRVKISTPLSGIQYDVTDLGAPVTVSPPPASAIAGNESPGLEPVSAFTTVAKGATAGVTWALQRAAGTQGTTCWRWQASPPLVQVGLNSRSAARCLQPPDPTADVANTIQFVAYGNGTGSYDALAAVVPAGVKKVTLGFVGGQTRVLPAGSPFVWVGPTHPVKGYLGVTLASGTVVDCGAGAISGVSDLTDDTLTSRAATSAWACVPQ